MKMIKTHEGYAVNAAYLLTIQSVLVNIDTYDYIEILSDEMDVETVEFGILATTVYGEELILAVYATEEERDYARYKLENWLISDAGNYYKMAERK